MTRVAAAAVLAGVAGAACPVGLALLLSGRAWRPAPFPSAVSFARRARRRIPIGASAPPPGLARRNWWSVKLASAAVAVLLSLPFAVATRSRLALVLAAGVAAAGFALPDVWLGRQRRRRDEAVLRALPDMLDLLRVTVEAGLAPARGLGVVAAEFRGPLAVEWGRVAAEVALGVPQEEALAGLRHRLPDEETASFVETLSRSRRHGVPLGTALAGQATRARHRRRQQLRERAARAGPKIQLAVALLMVPSVLLLVAAALIAELQRSGLGFG